MDDVIGPGDNRDLGLNGSSRLKFERPLGSWSKTVSRHDHIVHRTIIDFRRRSVKRRASKQVFQRKSSNFTAIGFARSTQSSLTVVQRNCHSSRKTSLRRSFGGETSPYGTANLLQRKHIHAEKWAKSRPFAIISFL